MTEAPALSRASGWDQNFTYDTWGNLLKIEGLSSGASSPYNGCRQNSLNVSVDSNNRILSPVTYDTAGNVMSDAANRRVARPSRRLFLRFP
jgi:hypothetical protein